MHRGSSRRTEYSGSLPGACFEIDEFPLAGPYMPAEADDTTAAQHDLFMMEIDFIIIVDLYVGAVGTLIGEDEISLLEAQAGVDTRRQFRLDLDIRLIATADRQ